MFNHIFVGTNDIDTSRKFYDATMGVLGFGGHPLPHGTVYPSEHGSFIVAKPGNGEVATCDERLHFRLQGVRLRNCRCLACGGPCQWRDRSKARPVSAPSRPGNMYGRLSARS